MIWLSTSLFCKMRDWNKLFTGGIIPFVANNNLSGGYTIEFNYLSGENIRLRLLTDEANAFELAKATDNYFKAYFTNAEFPVADIKLPLTGIFMTFPANTIQYGLYPPKNMVNTEVRDYSFSVKISQIMLDALQDDEIDDETILTFAFYLRMGLIKTAFGLYPQFIKDLKNTGNQLGSPGIEMKMIQAHFDESKEMLAEIAHDIMKTPNEAGLPAWLFTWTDLCQQELANNTETRPINTIYHELLHTVHRHLGVAAKMSAMLNYFTNQTLKQNLL